MGFLYTVLFPRQMVRETMVLDAIGLIHIDDVYL
jgi:hypothetical protein